MTGKPQPNFDPEIHIWRDTPCKRGHYWSYKKRPDHCAQCRRDRNTGELKPLPSKANQVIALENNGIGIVLFGGLVATVDAADYSKVGQYKWTLHPADGVPYARAIITRRPRKTTGIARLILDAPPHLYVDHIDGDPLNNRRVNLRLCVQAENSRNRRKPKNTGSSRYKGVSHRPPSWHARIGFEGKHISLGFFSTEEEAALAYNAAAELYFGEFAKLNEVHHEQL